MHVCTCLLGCHELKHACYYSLDAREGVDGTTCPTLWHWKHELGLRTGDAYRWGRRGRRCKGLRSHYCAGWRCASPGRSRHWFPGRWARCFHCRFLKLNAHSLTHNNTYCMLYAATSTCKDTASGLTIGSSPSSCSLSSPSTSPLSAASAVSPRMQKEIFGVFRGSLHWLVHRRLL